MNDAQPPRIDVQGVLRRRDRLFSQVFQSICGEPLTAERLGQVVQAVRRQVSGAAYDTIYESLRSLADGRPVTATEALAAAWRLAANVSPLREGRPVVAWQSQAADEWAGFSILRCRGATNRFGQRGSQLNFLALTGSAAGETFWKFWRAPVTRLAAYKLGFARNGQRFRFRRAVDLVGLRFVGMIEAKRSRQHPDFHQIECPPGLQRWNRENVLKLRCRVRLRCPRGYPHHCCQCVIGYDQCPAATHPLTYVLGACPRCQAPEAVCDPDDASGNCLQCAAAVSSGARR